MSLPVPHELLLAGGYILAIAWLTRQYFRSVSPVYVTCFNCGEVTRYERVTCPDCGAKMQDPTKEDQPQ